MKKKILLLGVKFVASIVATAFAAQISLVLADHTGQNAYINHVAPVFGVCLGIVLVGGVRYLPAVFVGTLIPYIYADGDLLAKLSVPVAAIVSVLFAAEALSLLRVRMDMERIRESSLIVLVGIGASTLIGAIVESAFLYQSEVSLGPNTFVSLVLSSWLAAGIGSVIVTPFIIAWALRSSYRFRPTQIFEVFFWFFTLIFFGFVTFENWAPTDVLLYPMELAIFPIMAWAATRFGMRGASAGVLVLAMVAGWELMPAMSGRASMIAGDPGTLWIFVGIVSITSITLASVMAELRHREAEISENESRLRAFTEALPDIAFVISADGEIQDIFSASPMIEANHLISNADLLRGGNLRDIFGAGILDEANRTIAAALRQNRVQTLEYSLGGEGGAEHWFEARVSPMAQPEAEPGRVVWVAYNITRRKQYEAAIKQRDIILDSTARANNYLLTTQDFRGAVESAVSEVGNALGVDRGYLFELILKPDEDFYRVQAPIEWRKGGLGPSVLESGEFEGAVFDELFPGWNARVVDDRSIKVVSDTASAADQEILKRLKSRSLLAVAIWGVGRPLGFFVVDYFSEPHEWTNSEMNAVRVLASGFSGLILMREREEELRVARDRADAASSAKGEFLAMMSHEIRTPMNAIIGYTDLLVQTELSETQAEQAAIIKRSGTVLLDLINSILDYSKIEARTLELETKEMEVEQVICEAFEAVLPKSKEKGLVLDYKIAATVADAYLGDSHRLRQILINLVNNAVKFTDAGSVRMEVERRVEEDAPGREALYFKVIDTGCGIPDEKFEILFQPFTQVDSSTTRKYGGTGLGLAISKRLVEQMDGRIWLESSVGEGTTFHFIVRLKRKESGPGERNAGPSRVPKDSGDDAELLNSSFAAAYPLEILVCEDDPDNRCMLQEWLENLGYQPAVAEDGSGLVSQAKVKTFDVILLDIRLPERSGIDLTTAIRKGVLASVDPRQYIVAVTAFAMTEDRDKCLAAGMNDYLSKPLEIARLKTALRNAHSQVSG